MLKRKSLSLLTICVLAASIFVTQAVTAQSVMDPQPQPVMDSPAADIDSVNFINSPIDDVATPPKDIDYWTDKDYKFIDDYTWYFGDDDYEDAWSDYDWAYEEWDNWGEGDWEEGTWDEDWEEGMWDEDYYWDNYNWEDEKWDNMALDFFDLYYKVEEFFYLLEEIENIYEEYEMLGIEMPADLGAGLIEIETEANSILNDEKLALLYGLARDAIEAGDELVYYEDQEAYLMEQWKADYSEDLIEVRTMIAKFWEKYPYEILDAAWDAIYGFSTIEDIEAEIQWLMEDISNTMIFFEGIEALDITEQEVLEAYENLKALANEALLTLGKMQEKIDAGIEDPAVFDEYWEIMWDIEDIAFENMEIILDYIEDYGLMEDLIALIPEEYAYLGELLMMEEPYFEEEYDYYEDFGTYYNDIGDDDFMDAMIGSIEEEMFKQIVYTISENLMAELAPYLEDAVANEIISNLMNSLNVLGDDTATKFLKNEAEVFKKMDFDVKGAPHHKDKIEALHKRTKETVIPDKYKDELGGLWEKLRNMTKFGDDSEDILEVTNEIEAVLDKIDQENIFGETPVEFYDVKFGKEWYWEPVISSRGKGCIGGYSDEAGNLTGYFGPGDPVTYAEALKMTMVCAGYEPILTAEGPWYQGYLKKLDEMGLARLNSSTYADWNAPAPRGDIVLMVNEIFGLSPVPYVEGTFPDVKAADPLADDAMASYLSGIFTGEGDTGDLNPKSTINRAAFAKVVDTGAEYLREENFVKELEVFRDKL